MDDPDCFEFKFYYESEWEAKFAIERLNRARMYGAKALKLEAIYKRRPNVVEGRGVSNSNVARY